MTKTWHISPINWILNLKGQDTMEVEALLLRTLIEGHLMAISTHLWTQIGLGFAWVVTGWIFILPLVVVDVAIFAAGWRIRSFQVKNRATGLTTIDRLAVPLNLLWMAVLGIEIVILFNTPSLTGAFIATALSIGFMSYTAAVNAAFPRLTMLNVAMLNVALTIGLWTSPTRDLNWLAYLSPFAGIAYFILMRHTHGVIVNAVRGQYSHRQTSIHDPLTGLPNRILLLERLQSHCSARPKRAAGERLAVLCLDLDGFKTVNDQYGHAAGDWVLVQVGSILLASVRQGDTVSRLGGDEFVVLLPGAERPTIEAIAGRIIEAVSVPMNLGEAVQARVGVSIGVAIQPDDGTEADELLKKADAALYAAKRGGRGCTQFASMERGPQPRLLQAAA